MRMATKPIKGSVPVLTNPRLNTCEYVEPMEIVLFTDNKKEYKVKDLYNEVINLRKENKILSTNYNKLVDFLMGESQEVLK